MASSFVPVLKIYNYVRPKVEKKNIFVALGY